MYIVYILGGILLVAALNWYVLAVVASFTPRKPSVVLVPKTGLEIAHTGDGKVELKNQITNLRWRINT